MTYSAQVFCIGKLLLYFSTVEAISLHFIFMDNRAYIIRAFFFFNTFPITLPDKPHTNPAQVGELLQAEFSNTSSIHTTRPDI